VRTTFSAPLLQHVRNVALLCLLCGMPHAGIQAQQPNEARVKAKLTFTLARFTQWPAGAFANATDPLVICLAQRNSTTLEAMTELVGQTVAGHLVKVIALADGTLQGCHVLFMHESASSTEAQALAAASSLPVLTIGDGEGFSARGGMVELVNVNDAMRLDVNLKALRAAQISLSSQVLKLARQVRE
jgi:hypothetical protein